MCDINHKKKGEKMNSVSCTDKNRPDTGQTMTTMTVTTTRANNNINNNNKKTSISLPSSKL